MKCECDHIYHPLQEWMVNVIKSLYEGVTTAIKRNGEESESFEIKVWVHQGSVLSPLLFNIVMQAIADNFKKGLPWELLYADDLVLLAESRLELEKRLTEWMARLKEKGLRKPLPVKRSKMQKTRNCLSYERLSYKRLRKSNTTC